MATDKTTNINDLEQRARELLDARMDSVRSLVRSRQHLSDLREQLAEAEREDARHYRVALSDGWAAEELRKLGLDEPARPRTSRRKSNRPGPRSTARATHSDASVESHQSPEATG